MNVLKEIKEKKTDEIRKLEKKKKIAMSKQNKETKSNSSSPREHSLNSNEDAKKRFSKVTDKLADRDSNLYHLLKNKEMILHDIREGKSSKHQEKESNQEHTFLNPKPKKMSQDFCIKKLKKTLNHMSSFSDEKTNRSPIAVSEDLSNKILKIIDIFSLNKFNNCISREILDKVNESKEFTDVKAIAHELKRVNMTKFSNNEEKACFLLNIFNSLVIFSIITNRHRPDTLYAWRKELKSGLFEIGGYFLSLIDIACFIRNSSIFICEEKNFSFDNERLKHFISKFRISPVNLIAFGISIPIRYYYF